MRQGFVGCLLVSALILGCGKKVEPAKGNPLWSKNVEIKESKGKMVSDELPATPTN